MSKFQVIDNITIPTSTRTRQRGEFALAVDALEVGQGFHYSAGGKLQSQYAKVSPSKFEGKKFKVWLVAAGQDGAENTYGVARLDDNSTEGAGEVADNAAE